MGEVIRRVKWLVWELYDNLELKNLHVYGDLLTFYNLPVSDASLAEIGRLYIKFRVFEARLLTLYASYILSRAGYYIADIASDDFAEIEEKRFTRHSLTMKTGLNGLRIYLRESWTK